MMRDIDTIEFENEDGEIVDFYVLEQTMLSGTNYILVTDKLIKNNQHNRPIL